MVRNESAGRRWSAQDVGDQSGRVVLVTGANTGIGLVTAQVLAEHGARVVLACRDEGRSGAAADRIRAAVPGADIECLRLDLASLASVRDAASRFRDRHERLDLLINNAGVMHPPYQLTEDGFELQFGVNHLGHFALTGLLLDLMLPVAGSRVVALSSIAHRRARIDFADLQSATGYRKVQAYAQSKLANLMFTHELQRRLTAAGCRTTALAAHPGVTRTDLPRHMAAPFRVLTRPGFRFLWRMVFQEPEMGALPTLRAAVDPEALPGGYYGPAGPGEIRGYPVPVRSAEFARDPATCQRLWLESERLTGVEYRFAMPGTPASR